MPTRHLVGKPGRGADASRVRSHNLSVIVDDVRRHTPTTRADISSRTGLARASLTNLVPVLVKAGLLRETATSGAVRGGRPAGSIEFDGSHLGVVAAELTVSDVVVESVDLAGRTLFINRAPHGRPLGDPEAVIRVLADVLDQHLDSLSGQKVSVTQVVVVVPAPLSGDPPIVVASTDLHWGAVDVLSSLTAALPRVEGMVTLVNDANVAVLAEAHALAAELGHPLRDVIYLKSLTGIGGGAITSGVVITGSKGIAFEPGHIVVRPHGRDCVCGQTGCFVAETGPEVVLEWAGLDALMGTAGVSVAVAELVDRVRAQEPRAVAAVAAAGRAIESMIVSLATTLNPERVILGGYWAEVFDGLQISPRLGLPDGSIFQILTLDEQGEPNLVVPGRLGARAARLGALNYAIDRALSDMSPL
jgi:predicted NBD/HSP70 family sugar kinase